MRRESLVGKNRLACSSAGHRTSPQPAVVVRLTRRDHVAARRPRYSRFSVSRVNVALACHVSRARSNGSCPYEWTDGLCPVPLAHDRDVSRAVLDPLPALRSAIVLLENCLSDANEVAKLFAGPTGVAEEDQQIRSRPQCCCPRVKLGYASFSDDL